jgi:hypothetical protein
LCVAEVQAGQLKTKGCRSAMSNSNMLLEGNPQHPHYIFFSKHFQEREEQLRKILDFWLVTKRIVYSLLLTVSFLIFYLLSKLNEALSMLN